MKNKILSFILITLIAILTSVTSVFASFADFTDEQADKQAQEQIKEQEKEHNVTQVKSSDNYLASLQVEGYTLTPEFDKQTLEYTIKEEINKNEINIKATASNENATTSGTGIVKIEDGKKDYRIDVTAENGAVRTYVIKINNINIKTDNETVIEEKIEETEPEEIVLEELKPEEINNESNNNIYIICGVAVLVGIILIILLKHKKSVKHRRKH